MIICSCCRRCSCRANQYLRRPQLFDSPTENDPLTGQNGIELENLNDQTHDQNRGQSSETKTPNFFINRLNILIRGIMVSQKDRKQTKDKNNEENTEDKRITEENEEGNDERENDSSKKEKNKDQEGVKITWNEHKIRYDNTSDRWYLQLSALDVKEIRAKVWQVQMEQ